MGDSTRTNGGACPVASEVFAIPSGASHSVSSPKNVLPRRAHGRVAVDS